MENNIQKSQNRGDGGDLYLYVERIKWMDENGIRGWNTTNYLARYPLIILP